MIDGKWTLVEGEAEGQDLTDDVLSNSKLEIAENRHTVKLGDELLQGTHTLDTDASPSRIDATDSVGPFAGQTLAGIFKLEGDLFTVCFAGPGEERPTEFTTKSGTGKLWHVWKRQES